MGSRVRGGRLRHVGVRSQGTTRAREVSLPRLHRVSPKRASAGLIHGRTARSLKCHGSLTLRQDACPTCPPAGPSMYRGKSMPSFP